VSYISYTFVDMGELLGYAVRLVLIGVIASGACWCACYAIYTAWTNAGPARRRRRRAETALRAEVARGLAEIELFLQARSAYAVPADPDTDGEEDDPGMTQRRDQVREQQARHLLKFAWHRTAHG